MRVITLDCRTRREPSSPSLARDEAGYVYSWGFGGLGRLGQGVQADVLTPKVIAQFAHDRDILRARSIAAGPTCSLVVDGNGMQYLFGKFKISGDGSSGQPWMTCVASSDLFGQGAEKPSTVLELSTRFRRTRSNSTQQEA